jgi:large subunit ribosomal protein L19
LRKIRVNRSQQDSRARSDFRIRFQNSEGLTIMTNLIIEKLLAKTQRTDIPKFNSGDTVRVHVKIKEGDKERLQAFEGVVIKRDNGPQASFTVRKISFGQGVERIFPIHSKVIDKVDLLRSSKVRRAKLYYLRGLKGKAARLRDVEKTS